VEELFRMIRKLKAEGVGIVYISHKMDEIQQIADRITVLRDGTYVGTVPAHTPMNDIITMMVGRPLSAWQKTVPDVANQPVALEVSGLSRGRAVQSVSLRVRRGEILGLAGLMGAGRTEVARIIFGADKMDAGEVRVNGRSVCLRTPRDAVRAGVGYVSEDRKRFGLVTGMDVQSNITLPSLARWLRWRLFLRPAAIRRVATEMTQQLGIKTPSLTQKVKLLSGGNQQKVVIAKWLVQQSEVLIFDEPTRGIDVGAKQEIYKLINELAAQGRAIILISSELPEILQISHRIAVMCEGRLTGELDAREATQENQASHERNHRRTQPFHRVEPAGLGRAIQTKTACVCQLGGFGRGVCVAQARCISDPGKHPWHLAVHHRDRGAGHRQHLCHRHRGHRLVCGRFDDLLCRDGWGDVGALGLAFVPWHRRCLGCGRGGRCVVRLGHHPAESAALHSHAGHDDVAQGRLLDHHRHPTDLLQRRRGL
jgi:ABC-type multidrug transport system ATPase subunit